LPRSIPAGNGHLKLSRPRLVPARPKVCTSHVREPLLFPKRFGQPCGGRPSGRTNAPRSRGGRMPSSSHPAGFGFIRNVQRFRGGLVFKSHRLVYHSTLGLRAIKKKKRRVRVYGFRFQTRCSPCATRPLCPITAPGLAWGFGFLVSGGRVSVSVFWLWGFGFGWYGVSVSVFWFRFSGGVSGSGVSPLDRERKVVGCRVGWLEPDKRRRNLVTPSLELSDTQVYES